MYYRTSGAWGAGKGSNLTAPEFDSNTYQLVQMINAKAAQGVGIASFSVVGDELWVTLTDHSILGPYPLPVSSITFVGDWQPSHQYFTNQIFTINGSTYIVLNNHTSASSFDAGANDGAGNDYYGLLLSNPSNALPTGGAPGQVLEKNLPADFSVIWVWPTLAGLHDVLPSPGPAAGDLVYWNGSAFSYVAQSTVRGAAPNLADLNDVLPSPNPATGDLVYWNGSAFTYLPQSDLTASAPVPNLAELADVLPSPEPDYGQAVIWNGSAFTYGTPTGGLLSDLSDVSAGFPKPLEGNDLLTYNIINHQWRNNQLFTYTSMSFGAATPLDISFQNALVDAQASGSSSTLVIPAHSAVAFPTGAMMWFRNYGGTGFPVVLAPDTGVTLTCTPGRLPRTRAYGSVITLQQGQTVNTWIVTGDLAYDPTASALPGSGFTFDARLNDSDTLTWTPTATQTVNIVSGSVQFGRKITIVITTSGTSSFTITFGTGFKTTGTLATGTVASKVFVIAFRGDGTNFNEVSRTTAM